MTEFGCGRRKTGIMLGVVFLVAAGACSSTQSPQFPQPHASKSDANKPAARAATGRVKKVTDDALIVLVTKGAGAEEVTFIITKETRILRPGKFSTLRDVMEAETVLVKYVETDGKKIAMSVVHVVGTGSGSFTAQRDAGGTVTSAEGRVARRGTARSLDELAAQRQKFLIEKSSGCITQLAKAPTGGFEKFSECKGADNALAESHSGVVKDVERSLPADTIEVEVVTGSGASMVYTVTTSSENRRYIRR